MDNIVTEDHLHELISRLSYARDRYSELEFYELRLQAGDRNYVGHGQAYAEVISRICDELDSGKLLEEVFSATVDYVVHNYEDSKSKVLGASARGEDISEADAYQRRCYSVLLELRGSSFGFASVSDDAKMLSAIHGASEMV